MNALFRLGRVIELSEPSAVHEPLFEARKKQLADLPGKQKVIAKFVLDLARNHPSLSRRTLSTIASRRGYSFLGSGVDYSAYLRHSDHMAVKVHRASASQDRPMLELIQQDAKEQHALLKGYLGSVVVDSEVIIDEHILGSYQTVQIIQPFVDTDETRNPFVHESPNVKTEQIAEITRLIPGSDVALGEFCQRSKEAFVGSKVLPDTNGQRNVSVCHDGSVALIDTLAIGQEHPAVQDLIAQQITSLETALKEVA